VATRRASTAQEVYGAFIAATDDALESLDLLLEGHADARLGDLDQWEEFHQTRRKFDIARGQVRLVAPTNVADHARKTGFALFDFDRDAKNDAHYRIGLSCSLPALKLAMRPEDRIRCMPDKGAMELRATRVDNGA
jgi:hypothetical protein